MGIYNRSKRCQIASEAIYCKSEWSKAWGLMFSKRREERVLIFSFDRPQLIPLHMLFVFYPIDVLFLNENKEVIEIKEKLRPFCFYNPQRRSKFVIEVAAGKVQKSQTKVKDRLSF
ncbi:MAG TPA: DUF192 domain-containing protein [Candidatus Nanoarchaeia archaeon]|nr:DUF192 domain-containing protein [Candidatus Nanoarchaeia archaeon]